MSSSDGEEPPAGARDVGQEADSVSTAVGTVRIRRPCGDTARDLLVLQSRRQLLQLHRVCGVLTARHRRRRRRHVPTVCRFGVATVTSADGERFPQSSESHTMRELSICR